MSRRRKQLAAAGGGALIIAVVLAVVLAGGSGSSHSISVPAPQIPTKATDPHAHDRAQITALTLAYQQALGQANGANPCNYLDPQSLAFATTQATHGYAGGPEPCAFAANQLSGGAGGLSPSGIDPSTIQFGLPSQQVRCDPYSAPVSLPASQHGLSWAIAGWAGANGNQVAVVKENNRWRIDLLLCHA
jgi:hypothetical protein